MQVSLKAMRTNANLSLEEVSEKIGVNRNTIAKWEAGKSAPDLQIFDTMCSLYGCTRDDIFFLIS